MFLKGDRVIDKRKLGSNLLFLSLVSLLSTGCPSRALLSAGVNGTVFTELPRQGGNPILLPDVDVFLRSVSTGTEHGRVSTDLVGHYEIPPQPGGRYQVCFEAPGYAPGCVDGEIEIDGKIHYMKPLPITPVRGESPDGEPQGVAFGQVTFSDRESLCRAPPAVAGFDLTAKVVALDGGGNSVGSARANDRGFYVLAGISANATVAVRADCEAIGSTQSVTGEQLVGDTPVNIVLDGLPPKRVWVRASLAGQIVRDAPAGSTVQLRAHAAGGDGSPITYKWRAASGTLSSTTGETVDWTLPPNRGIYQVVLTASDGRGGYRSKLFNLHSRNPDGTEFSGVVVDDQSAQPIAGVTVSINGPVLALQTDGNGTFRVIVPPSKRYALAFRKPGYAPLVPVALFGSRGRTYRMSKAPLETFDPSTGVVLVDRRRGQEYGATVRIPPDALVDKTDRKPPPSGAMLRGSIFTRHAVETMISGDFSAINLAGKPVFLQSLGSLSIEVYDSTETIEYTLADGRQARVEFPLPSQVLAKAPERVETWTMDNDTATWKQDPVVARRVGGRYEFDLSDFSEKNFDLEKTTPACIQVEIDTAVLPISSNLQVRAVAHADSGDYIQTLDADNQFNVFYNLPPGVEVDLTVLDANDNEIAGTAQTVHAGLEVVGGVPPAPDYDACRNNPGDLDAGYAFMTIQEGALGIGTYLFLGNGGGTVDLQTTYYDTIDPNLCRRTMGEWWNINGFGANGQTFDFHASYMNNGDLGFGRDMYCNEADANGNVACYVTNYGGPDQDPANAVDAFTQNPATRAATVAMEYSPVDTGGAACGTQGAGAHIVKFYVYNTFNVLFPNPADADLRNRVDPADDPLDFIIDLDGDPADFGFVPNICLNCHGGSKFSDVVLDPDLGARFREFDTPSFVFPAAANEAAQACQTKGLNRTVLLDTTPTSGIAGLINGWYDSDADGNFDELDPLCPLDGTFVPIAWNPDPGLPDDQTNPAHLYRQVVATSCRTCHVAFDPAPNANANALQWTEWQQFLDVADGFNIIDFAVCDTVVGSRYMPHALVTWKNFWTSTNLNRPGVLKDFDPAASVDPLNIWPTGDFAGCVP